MIGFRFRGTTPRLPETGRPKAPGGQVVFRGIAALVVGLFARGLTNNGSKIASSFAVIHRSVADGDEVDVFRVARRGREVHLVQDSPAAHGDLA
jgi:hypothetical protein